MIVGVTGYYSSGKDCFAKYLETKGFIHYSLSDELRNELKKRKKKITRENLIEIGNEIRKEYGPDILSKRIIKKIKTKKNYVISSIRNNYELLSFKEFDDFIFVNIFSPIEIRIKRIKKRNREEDPKTLKELKQKETQENSKNIYNQNLQEVTNVADVIIKNDLSLKIFYGKIEKVLKDRTIIQTNITKSIIKKRSNYISWDEYFMGIALLSAKRSKDPNTQVGACIVDHNKKIVGIGYNGFPIGCSDNELPWVREAKNINNTKYPYVVHAEANAILNSTTKLNGTKLYVTLFPCNECVKLIIQSGIKEIIFLSDKYRNINSCKAAEKMLKMVGVKIRKLNLNKKILIDFEKY
ncbi:AAA family ATPase [archaeon]|nr:AAA family ATPase [archaeon]